MKNLFILCTLYLCLAVHAQPPGKFSVVYGGTGDDVAYDIKQCLDGNYILTGSSSSAGNGQTDVYLLKIDSLGQKMWEKYIGGAGSEVGRSVLLLPDSGFIITGFTSSFGNGGYDLYIVRTNKFGELLWQKAIGGNDWDFGYSSVLTSDTKIMAVGSGFSNGNQDVLMVKIDTMGTVIWEKRFGGTQEDAAKTIYTPDGTHFFIAGITKSRGESNGDIYLLKTDTNGDTIFTSTYGHASLDYANSVITDPGGNILIASAITYSNGNKDASIVKTNSLGVLLWEKNYGLTQENKEMYCILRSTLPLLGEEVALFSSSEIQGNGKDTKTIYINSAGDYFGGWFSGTFGYLQDDEIYSMSACRDKGYISCGYTRSFSQSASNQDILIIKRDSVLNYGVSITGVEEMNNSIDLRAQVYPNPVSAGQKEMKYAFRSLQTKLLSAQLYDAGSKRIDIEFKIEESLLVLPELLPGIYFLQLYTDQGIWGTKVVVME